MTLDRITTRLAAANDLIEVAMSVCTLSHELYGIYSCIVSIHDVDGRPLHAVDNAPNVSDQHRRDYFDEIWRQDPLLFFLRITGNHAAESPEHVTLERGVGYMDHVVHTVMVPLLCPRGLLGAIKFRHEAHIAQALQHDLTTLGTAASVRLTELNIAARLDPIVAQLTPRKLDVARSAALGLTNAEIGLALGLSENTVKKYLKEVFEQLDIGNRTELAGRIQPRAPLHEHPVGISHRGGLTITRASV